MAAARQASSPARMAIDLERLVRNVTMVCLLLALYSVMAVCMVTLLTPNSVVAYLLPAFILYPAMALAVGLLAYAIGICVSDRLFQYRVYGLLFGINMTALLLILIAIFEPFSNAQGIPTNSLVYRHLLGLWQAAPPSMLIEIQYQGTCCGFRDPAWLSPQVPCHMPTDFPKLTGCLPFMHRTWARAVLKTQILLTCLLVALALAFIGELALIAWCHRLQQLRQHSANPHRQATTSICRSVQLF